MKTPTLKTERLILEPINEKHILAIQEYFDDWEIIKNTQAPWPYPKDGAKTNMKEVLKKVSEGKQIAWAIRLPSIKKHDGFIGRIDYRFSEKENDRGFWMARSFQGNGYMTEAVVATQDYVLLERGIESFTVRNTKSNKASYRIKEKTGAAYIKEEQKPCSTHINEPVDVWEVTRENWAKIRGHKI